MFTNKNKISIISSETKNKDANRKKSAVAVDNIGGKIPNCTYTKTIVCSKTPVLFSTKQGIFLKKIKIESGNQIIDPNNSSNYDIKFCDLERWTTNRANTVSLLDDSIQNRNRSVKFVVERGQTSFR